MDLSGSWFGHISGTNRGPVSVYLRHADRIVLGRLLFRDLVHGNTSAWLDGEWDGRQLRARIDTIAGSAPALPSKGDVIVEIDESATRLTGEWKTDIGTSG
ncbi:MAG: hypothetical protein ACREM3_28400, partial [Candidatus Rokuibacteriota bacterium]